MSVSMFTNALRTPLRLRVPTVARVALPATRSISSLVAFRTAVVPKNVSLSVSRLFTTSQVAHYLPEGNTAKSPISSTIFVANIPWEAKEEDIRRVFSEFGEVTAVRLHTNRDGRPRGICHLDFVDQDSAVACIQSAAQEPLHMAGRDLRLDFAVGIGAAQSNIEPNRKLYFSGFNGDETELRTIFRDYSQHISDVHQLRSPAGEVTASGFVEFIDIDTATKALEALNGAQTAEGDSIALSYARPKRNQSSGGQRMRRSSPRWNDDH